MRLASFSGARLRDARHARSMAASVLAERLGVTPGAVSQYENHNTEPRPATLARISEVLELPQAYFLRQPAPRDGAPYLYRSQVASTKRARESAEARLSWLREIAEAVECDVELPVPTVTAADVPAHFAAITDEQIERAATAVRTEWRLGDGPIPTVVGLLERMGCIVSAFAFGSETLSAFSQRAQDRPYVILNSDEDACARWRFNAAHELGHLVLHRSVSRAEAASPPLHKLLENQAHRFASAFLLPAESFSEELYSLSLDVLQHAKSRWRVSMQAMLRRARDLKLVSQDKYERASRELSRRGYRLREPLDDELPTEPPQLLSQSLQLMLSERATTREDLLHQLPFSHADIEILSGLPRGFLAASTWGEVAELKLRQPDPTPFASPHGSGKVLQFRSRLPV